MVPVKFQVVGEEDYAFVVQIDAAGGYVVQSGTYTSHPPRKGVLTEAQQSDITAAIAALAIPASHPMPEDASAFEAKLTVGAPGEEVIYPFFEGALEEDEKLKTLVRLLEML